MGGKFLEVSVDFLCLIIYNVNCCDVGLYKIIVINVVGFIISDVIVLSKFIIYLISLLRLINGKNMNYSNIFFDRYIIKLYFFCKIY